jgi:hypothetical protein
MSEAVAGWYPDPAGGAQQRWWDGAQWTNDTAPVAAGAGYPAQQPAWVYGQSVQQGYPQGQYGQQTAGYPIQGTNAPQQASSWRRNRYSFITMIVGVVYVLLAFEAHLVVIGILPVLMTVRAFRAREKLAPAAALVAGIAVAIGLFALSR